MFAILKHNMNLLVALGIDFLPNKVIKDDKTTGCVAADFCKIAKVMNYVSKHIEIFLKQKNQGNDNMKN